MSSISTAPPISSLPGFVEPLSPDTGQVPGKAAASTRSEYLFVSNVRFMSMLAIVSLHVLRPWQPEMASFPFNYLLIAIVLILKFGTFGFFMISGYLIGDGMSRGSRTGYFLRRAKKILPPWFLWSLVCFTVSLQLNHAETPATMHLWIQRYLVFAFIRSAYWFIPNFFVCLFLILVLHKRVPDWIQGAMFLACSLFYGINIYTGIVSADHTSAIFGYIFFMWLGRVAYKHRDIWSGWLERVSWTSLVFFTLMAVTACLAEIHLFRRLHPLDELSTLRISNQIFAVVITLLFAKSMRTLSPKIVHVRSETFGIYLLHPLMIQMILSDSIVSFVLAIAARFSMIPRVSIGVLLPVLSLFMIYGLSLGITKLLKKVPFLAWTVGSSPGAVRPSKEHRLAAV